MKALFSEHQNKEDKGEFEKWKLEDMIPNILAAASRWSCPMSVWRILHEQFLYPYHPLECDTYAHNITLQEGNI